MEDAVKPILIEMFGASSQVVLNADEQRTLSRWAFKTVCVLAQLDSTRPTIPLTHYQEFHTTDELPRGVEVRIGTASITNQQLGTMLVESHIVPSNANVTVNGQTTRFPFYQARFRLLNVVFDVTGTGPADDGTIAVLESQIHGELARALLPIFPPIHPKLWWPPAQTIDAIGGISAMMNIPVTGLPTLLPPTGPAIPGIAMPE
jgi:hypothetical protein